MRSSTEAGLPAWPTRILRPWFVATIAGSTLGISLLSFEPADAPNNYSEPATRAAVYEAPAIDPFGPVSVGDAPASGEGSTSAGTVLFAPAAPIAADLAPGQTVSR